MADQTATTRAAAAAARSQKEVQQTLDRLAEGPRPIDRALRLAQQMVVREAVGEEEIDDDHIHLFCGVLAAVGSDPAAQSMHRAFLRLDPAHQASAPHVVAGALHLLFEVLRQRQGEAMALFTAPAAVPDLERRIQLQEAEIERLQGQLADERRVKLTPEVAAFGQAFESLAQAGSVAFESLLQADPIWRSEVVLPGHLEVVISDNIGPRCTCPPKGRGKGRWAAHFLGRADRFQPPPRRQEPIPRPGEVILECERCGAAWEWGEICAQPTQKGGGA